MKKLQTRLPVIAALFYAGMLFSSCSGKPKDSDIQAAITEKSAADAGLSHISVAVKEGVVTLDGECPDEACKTHAEQAVKDIKGVKSVVNNIHIATPAAPQPAPVEIAADDALKNGVRDAVKDFPGVSADVANGEITLTGEIKRDNLQKLMKSLSTLKPKKINNKLTIK
jgi:osmotically-inducible protein OsmY